jgi:phage terminase large subunit
MSSLQVNIPETLQCFLEPNRYKVAYGGRGSGKSWTIAQLLVIQAYSKPTRILCAREIQRSISDSVIQLLSDTIDRMGLTSFFEVQKTQILAENGSRFIFEGLRSNVTKIKSMEGLDLVWVEEAESVTFTSWETLIPTMRKAGSEIWVSFNPRDEMDDTYQRFVIEPPPEAKVVMINWQDNPWFPEELRKEKDHLKKKDDNLYQWIWEGKPVANHDGAYWQKHINQKQILDFPIEGSKSVHTFWDLGVSDDMTIWFMQVVGTELRFIHSFSDYGEGLDYYVNYLHEFRAKHKIVFGDHWAPHDISVRELTTGKSRLETAKSMGIEFKKVPNIPIEDGINAVRQILPRCWFNQSMTQEGLKALKGYRREFDEVRGVFKKNPLHNWASHYADAFRYFAVAFKDKVDKKRTKKYPKLSVA